MMFKSFYHIWVTTLVMHVLDHLYKLLFQIPIDAPHEFRLCFAKRFQRRCFQNTDHIQVCSPGAGANSAPGHNVFINIRYLLSIW